MRPDDEREDYAEPSGLDDAGGEALRGATRDWVMLVLGSAILLWAIGVLVGRGLLH